MNFELDDLTMQRFADAELTDDERRDVLRHMDDDPTKWRRLALAFVELQIWNEAFALAEPAAQAPKAIAPSSPAGARRAIPSRGFTRWITLSAGWLLALVLGYSAANVSRSLVPQQTVGPEHPRRIAQEAPQVDRVALRLEEAVSRSAWPVPDSLHLSLLRSGYYLDEVHTTKPVKLPTGEEIEIPIREVSLQYLGSAAFQ